MTKDGIYTAVVKNTGRAEEVDNCSISVIPWSDWNKLLVRVTAHYNQGDSCLSFAQGRNGTAEIPGLSGEYCGADQPPLNFQFVMERLYIYYKTYTPYFYQSFTVVVTVFKNAGDCHGYKCENDQCIPNDLKCTFYNPCGDSSDCPTKGSHIEAVNVGKVIGFIVGPAAGIVLLMCLIRRCMVAAGKESDGWDSEPEPPTMNGDRTPSLHESDWQSDTRDDDRFYNDSLHESDWRSETSIRGRLNDNNSDESFDLQPFYTSEGRARSPFYESRGVASRQENISQNNLSNTTAESSAVPSTPIRNSMHFSPFHSNTMLAGAEEMEMNPIVVHESDFNSREISGDATRQRDFELPPPSYETVMANENIIPANSE